MSTDNRYKSYKRVTLLLSPETIEIIQKYRSQIPGKAGLSRFIERVLTEQYDPANDPCNPYYGKDQAPKDV